MSGLRSTPSNTSTGSAGQPVLKITLQRPKREPEVRRIRGSFTFDELHTIVGHMWSTSAPKRLVLEYVDEDGDHVRVGSQLEWAEAQQQADERGERVLRLFARKGTRRGEKAAAESSSDSDSEEAPAAPAIDRVASSDVVPPVPKLSLDRVPTAETTAAPLEPTLAAAATTDAAPPRPASSEPPMDRQATASSTVTDATGMVEALTDDPTQTAEAETTMSLVSRLFECDAVKELHDPFSRINFGAVAARRVDAVAQEVHVDIDKTALRHLTTTRTNMWIGQGLHEKAESTLADAIALWPGDSLFEYNAACSAALRGDKPKALAMVSAAVGHGFRNVQQLRRDPDLAAIRSMPEFAGVVERARGEVVAVPEEEEPAAPEPSTEDHEDPTTAADDDTLDAVTARPDDDDDVDRLMAMFPHFNIERARAHLQAFGSLQAAVEDCMNGST